MDQATQQASVGPVTFEDLQPIRVVFDESGADNVVKIECDRIDAAYQDLSRVGRALGDYGTLRPLGSRIEVTVREDFDLDDALRRIRLVVAPKFVLVGRPWLNDLRHTESFEEGGIDVDQPLSDDQIAKVLDLKTKLVGVDDIKIDDNRQTISVDFNLYSGANQNRAARTLRRLALALQIELEAPVTILTDDTQTETPRDYLGESLLQSLVIVSNIFGGRLPVDGNGFRHL